MAPSAPVERIRLEDILLPMPSSSASTPPRRKSQVARKSTGGMPPRKMMGKESSSNSASPGPSQCARKSTGGLPQKSTISPSPMPETCLEPLNMPIRNNKSRGLPLYRQPTDAAGTPDSDGTEHSRAGSSDPSSSRRGPRKTQTARKTTGGAPPQRQSDKSIESTPSPHRLSLPSILLEDAAPVISCGLCPVPLLTPYANPDPSQPIHRFLTLCQHNFHYADLLISDRYWVHATTHTDTEGQTDLTENVEERLFAVRQARQQIFIDMLASRSFQIAASLLAGPEPIDVNCPTPAGGFTPLHFFAMLDNVLAIDFLLSHGADKGLKNEAGLLPIDCARSNNAWNAVTRLT
ncbi:hypothetical protein B0H17DRAFT_1210876 [Mycena rosella]|uniref:Ankyrin repeat protein n=1 Tax=Mycena rosella TaxID=1033263 RepID=A0AAD7CVV4_MYCRO|nr:hypothetical protein B0H17DRAFT_1210876 [Mycena rosella]